MTLTSRISQGLNFNTFLHQRGQWQLKNILFQYFSFISLRVQIGPYYKISQGHYRVIIYINFKELTPQMLHTKFQCNRRCGSGEKDFLKVIPIYGHGSHLGHVTQTKYINFLSLFAWRLHIKFISNWPIVLEKKSFENVDGQGTTDARRHRLPSYKLPRGS